MCHQHLQTAPESLVAIVAGLSVAPFKVRVLCAAGGAVYRQATLGWSQGCLQTNHERLQALEQNTMWQLWLHGMFWHSYS